MDGLLEAKRRWPKAIWIDGNGEYASVSHCHPGVTVWLFDTREEAETANAGINALGCGGYCRKLHEIVCLSEPASQLRVTHEVKRKTDADR